MSGARAKKKQRRGARGEASGGVAEPRLRAARRRPAPPPPPRASRSATASRARSRVWAPFPLTEIGMAAGLAIFVAGVLSDGRRAAWLLAVAVLMLVVVVAELCLREHFAGFRSHTLLLAVLPVAILDGLLVLALGDALRGPLVLVAALGLAGALGWWLRERFRVARDRATAAPDA